MTILDLFVKYNKNTSKQFLNHSNSFKLLFKHFQTTVVLVRVCFIIIQQKNTALGWDSNPRRR